MLVRKHENSSPVDDEVLSTMSTSGDTIVYIIMQSPAEG